jgi:hypothetical protein
MNIDYRVRNSIYCTGRIALRLRLNRARLTFNAQKNIAALVWTKDLDAQGRKVWLLKTEAEKSRKEYNTKSQTLHKGAWMAREKAARMQTEMLAYQLMLAQEQNPSVQHLAQLKAYQESWVTAMEECDDAMIERENLWIWQEQVEGEYRQALESMYMVAFNACAAAGLPPSGDFLDGETTPENIKEEETAKEQAAEEQAAQEHTAQGETTQEESAARGVALDEKLQADIKQRREEVEHAEERLRNHVQSYPTLLNALIPQLERRAAEHGTTPDELRKLRALASQWTEEEKRAMFVPMYLEKGQEITKEIAAARLALEGLMRKTEAPEGDQTCD